MPTKKTKKNDERLSAAGPTNPVDNFEICQIGDISAEQLLADGNAMTMFNFFTIAESPGATWDLVRNTGELRAEMFLSDLANGTISTSSKLHLSIVAVMMDEDSVGLTVELTADDVRESGSGKVGNELAMAFFSLAQGQDLDKLAGVGFCFSPLP